jgi:hypothetical protein
LSSFLVSVQIWRLLSQICTYWVACDTTARFEK